MNHRTKKQKSFECWQRKLKVCTWLTFVDPPCRTNLHHNTLFSLSFALVIITMTTRVFFFFTWMLIWEKRASDWVDKYSVKYNPPAAREIMTCSRSPMLNNLIKYNLDIKDMRNWRTTTAAYWIQGILVAKFSPPLALEIQCLMGKSPPKPVWKPWYEDKKAECCRFNIRCGRLDFGKSLRYESHSRLWTSKTLDRKIPHLW